MNARIYGKVINTWNRIDEKGRVFWLQKEIAYKEYNPETGKLVAEGTEDFSPERYYNEVAIHWVYTWDGKKRNAGGYRWFDGRGCISYRKSTKKAVKAYLQTRFEAELVELRK